MKKKRRDKREKGKREGEKRKKKRKIIYSKEETEVKMIFNILDYSLPMIRL